MWNTESSAPDKRLSNQTECRAAQTRHFLQTVILDREGRVETNLEGNQFSAQQLGDLIQTTLAQQ
ncbi:MAG: hypothetical protein WA826_12900 [Silvibacterium sp.]